MAFGLGTAGRGVMGDVSHRGAKPPSTAGIAAYATGSFGTGVFSTVPTVLLLYFCTETLHISAALAALTVFLPKAWAIIWDPLVGAWSDRSRSPFGRRRPFLAAGAIGVAASFVAVFTVQASPPFAAFVWVSIAYFGLATLYSLFAVPYIAIPAEVGATAKIRSRMVSWRMTVAMIGVLAGAGIAPLLVAQGGGGRGGYAYMALWVAAACAIAMTFPIVMMTGRDVVQLRGGQHPPMLGQILKALQHRNFVTLTLSYVFQLTAVGIISAAVPYIVTRAFGRSEADVGIGLLAMLSATTATVPLWAWAGRHFGERRMLVYAVVLFGMGAALLGGLAMHSAPWTIAVVALALAGIPFAGMQVLPFTLVAHMIHEEGRGGAAAEGAFTGVWTAAEKLGLAMGPAATGLALSLAHNDVVHGLTLFLMVAPFVLAIASLPLFISRQTAPELSATGAGR